MSLVLRSRREAISMLAVFIASAPSARLLSQEERLPKGAEDLDLEAIRELGQKYAEESGEDLAAIRDLSARLERGDLSDESILERLRLDMRADYDKDRLTHLEGWFLSRTEARVCAALDHLAILGETKP